MMHLVDTLEAGGAERMCVQLANAMAERGRAVTVCVTRRSGPLREELDARVGFVNLGRRWRFDANALWRLRREVERRGIRILHAHGTALFAAAAASAGRREVRVVWHVHYGGADPRTFDLALPIGAAAGGGGAGGERGAGTMEPGAAGGVR